MRHHRQAWSAAFFALASLGVGAQPSPERTFLDAYKWRSIGPARGGRSIAVSGVKGRPLEAYFGAVGGGLWKTLDGGTRWAPVTDGQIGSSSVGAVAVSESDPNVVFIGMGEACIRGNILPGDGVYKSTDAGKTWSHVGFKGVDAISKIRIHPTEPRTVFVAAFGRYGLPSDERGLFKSTDGGASWRKVLFRDARTGAVDVAIDRKDPRVMYAALWEAHRVEYRMSSGGPGSGLYKSTDGGESWTEITRSAGLPAGVVGKISVAISGADSNRVYALVENETGGLFQSDDAGRSWRLVNDDRRVRQRAFYYTHVYADTKDKDTVYMLNTGAFRSSDGGKTLAVIGGGTHGDHHDLWIDPDDPEHVVLANDGGGAVTFNVSSRQRTWSAQDFATAQFYHVVTTRHLPFHVCGSQQDNSSLCVPSDTGEGGRPGGGGGRVPPVAPYPVGGGEPGYIAPDPKDLDVFFAGTNNGGFLTRHNRRTGELKEVGAYPRFFSGEPASAVKERWQWTFPILFSPVDPRVLYTSSQRVWKSLDAGQTWEAISGDLTRHDPETLKESGGPITHDMNSPEIYATVFSLAPGRTDVNVLWAGSDDGLVHVTRDGGKSWTNVTPKELPAYGRVSQIDASAFDPAVAYVSVKKMLLGDQRPYIFRTRDFGRSWTKITEGLSERDYVHAVRADATRRGLLYAGTEHAFYVSFDDGDRWQRLSNGLPDTQISDVWVDANAIAIATHGRGFYVLDDIAALRQYDPAGLPEARLFKPADAVRGGSRAGLSYWLKAAPKSLTLEIADERGAVVRSYPGAPPQKPGAVGSSDEEGGPRRAPTRVPMAAGLNRFEWDLTTEPVLSFPGMVLWGATTSGPTVLPGTYQVRLTADGARSSEPLVVTRHPLRPIPDAELRIQYDLAAQIRDKVNEANAAVIRIRRIKKDVGDRLARSQDSDLRAAGERVTRSLSAVEEDLYQVKNRSNQDPLNFPIKTNNRLASLLRVVLTGEGVPTGNVVPIFDDLKAELRAELLRLEQAVAADLLPFNNTARRLGLPAVSEQ